MKSKIRALYRDELFRPLFYAVIIMIASFWFGMNAFAGENPEQTKINYLLDSMGASDLTFIHNNSEYTGEEARLSIQQKLDAAGDPIHSADDFITDLASVSPITGAPYFVRFADGTQMDAGNWLEHKLANMPQN